MSNRMFLHKSVSCAFYFLILLILSILWTLSIREQLSMNHRNLSSLRGFDRRLTPNTETETSQQDTVKVEESDIVASIPSFVIGFAGCLLLCAIYMLVVEAKEHCQKVKNDEREHSYLTSSLEFVRSSSSLVGDGRPHAFTRSQSSISANCMSSSLARKPSGEKIISHYADDVHQTEQHIIYPAILNSRPPKHPDRLYIDDISMSQLSAITESVAFESTANKHKARSITILDENNRVSSTTKLQKLIDLSEIPAASTSSSIRSIGSKNELPSAEKDMKSNVQPYKIVVSHQIGAFDLFRETSSVMIDDSEDNSEPSGREISLEDESGWTSSAGKSGSSSDVSIGTYLKSICSGRSRSSIPNKVVQPLTIHGEDIKSNESVSSNNSVTEIQIDYENRKEEDRDDEVETSNDVDGRVEDIHDSSSIEGTELPKEYGATIVNSLVVGSKESSAFKSIHDQTESWMSGCGVSVGTKSYPSQYSRNSGGSLTHTLEEPCSRSEGYKPTANLPSGIMQYRHFRVAVKALDHLETDFSRFVSIAMKHPVDKLSTSEVASLSSDDESDAEDHIEDSFHAANSSMKEQSKDVSEKDAIVVEISNQDDFQECQVDDNCIYDSQVDNGSIGTMDDDDDDDGGHKMTHDHDEVKANGTGTTDVESDESETGSTLSSSSPSSFPTSSKYTGGTHDIAVTD